MDTSCVEVTSQDQSAAESGPGSGPASPPVSPERPAPPRIYRAFSEGPPAPLEQEFLMINKNIDNVRIEKVGWPVTWLGGSGNGTHVIVYVHGKKCA